MQGGRVTQRWVGLRERTANPSRLEVMGAEMRTIEWMHSCFVGGEGVQACMMGERGTCYDEKQESVLVKSPDSGGRKPEVET